MPIAGPELLRCCLDFDLNYRKVRVSLDNFLNSISVELALKVIKSSLRGLDVSIDQGYSLHDSSPRGDDPSLYFHGKYTYLTWCPNCGTAQAFSVSSVAFGGKHITRFCEKCGGRLFVGRPKRDVVTTVSGKAFFDDPSAGLIPIDSSTVSEYTTLEKARTCDYSMRHALADYLSLGGMSPTKAWQTIHDSQFVDWIDVETVLVSSRTLRAEDEIKNDQPYVWIEAGERECGMPVENPELNSGGYTFDEAISHLALSCSRLAKSKMESHTSSRKTLIGVGGNVHLIPLDLE